LHIAHVFRQKMFHPNYKQNIFPTIDQMM